MAARIVVGAAVVLLLLTIGVGTGAGADSNGYSVRFFIVAAKDTDPVSRDFVLADEERAQDFLYTRTGLMFRVSSYEPIPFRLSETSADAASRGIREVEQVDRELRNAGYADPKVKNVMFYGGPSGVPGLGGTAVFGGGTAMIWFQNGGKFATVVHEVFHSMGIVPGCAAHEAGAHVTDDANDLMRSEADPAATGSTGTGQVIDANHDDYFNPALSSDGQTAVAIGSCPASENLANMPWVTHGVFPNLHLDVVGHGFLEVGKVGICSGSCDYPKAVGTPYALTPQPDNGWRFVGWGGSCTGTGACSVTMDTERSVTATFAPALVKVTVKIVGTGRVKGLLRGGGACTRTCTRSIAAGTKMRLTAIPGKGWRFASWTGCGHTCVFSASLKTVTARFRRAG
ncbi:MAG: hypothetical protein QOK34_1724 [Gaiellaceae bacterium]|nr:hypothetical protein [Gaiellaceae bacterium]